MILLLSGLWPGLLAALALGLGLGRVVAAPRGVAIGLGLAAPALAALAASGVVPGAPGFWLESAALMLAPYVVGCGLGALGRARATPRAEAAKA
ncbi:hypothetical protein [uncultured Methylobacterium sp.]|uniref:hypothetical protein n=1 Tax=uncultured Methylobacterium sp. TaxID=157278 RepID=UPI0035CBA563